MPLLVILVNSEPYSFTATDKALAADFTPRLKGCQHCLHELRTDQPPRAA
jgi:hypothetical protein